MIKKKHRIYEYHDKNVGVIVDEVSSSTSVKDSSLS
jgi:chemotaxis signal transduction protein